MNPINTPKEILALYQSQTREQLLALLARQSPGCCDDTIYKNGMSCAPVFATNMYATEFLCDLIRKMTGARVDWHYVGGRVNMLLHPGDKSKMAKVQEAITLIGISSANYPRNSFYARVYEIKREEIVAAMREPNE